MSRALKAQCGDDKVKLRRHQTKHRDKDGNYAINKLLLPPLEDVSLSLTIKSGASMMNLFFFATLVHSCLLTMDCGVTQ
ncbi:CLUMA_CG020070, isoform A [Clunio marinus]|uniref:CLUMA_CG020070, isoform A n=1 Tax=Clunio marinus TaxID=568069 RepID=A0A1J1J674_9DIPT|nr:CLUMA_CG020070, isoform A [Clunio marinus]